ncbi:MAG: protein-L-isoaspartate(D-aspartate) O-methyltransferase [Planctomycetes bacterium]|nr:protein-L-isoaspartate(D-aspartate) O-methyltransferase [Planctomycetota bacterium]
MSRSQRTGDFRAARVVAALLAVGLAACGGRDAPGNAGDPDREPPVIQPVDPKGLESARVVSDPSDVVNRRRRLVASWGGSIRDARVLAALAKVRRHVFVPESIRHSAYADEALPIGAGQTISQPWVVARMTELLELAPDGKVLEVGTGSGYQAAVLAELAAGVYTIEIIESLARRAQAVLEAEGYRNIRFRVGDGYAGWAEAAPFDAVIITAAVDHVPGPLVEQLKVGGRLVLPLGSPEGVQYLTRITRTADGANRSEQFSAVRFVPMTGKARE